MYKAKKGKDDDADDDDDDDDDDDEPDDDNYDDDLFSFLFTRDIVRVKTSLCKGTD